MSNLNGLRPASKRAMSNNTEYWRAIIKLSEANVNSFPFSARAVVREAGRGASAAPITTRGGLEQMQRQLQDELVTALANLLEKNNGHLGGVFCYALAFLIVDYQMLFALDIATDSHHNVKIMLEVIAPLLNPSLYPICFAEFYVLLVEWHNQQFAKELIMSKSQQELGFRDRIQLLFHKYQSSPDNMPHQSKEAA